MKTCHRGSAVFSLAFAALALGCGAPDEPARPSPDAEIVTQRSEAAGDGTVCTSLKRWVGIYDKPGLCPASANPKWVAARLFPDPAAPAVLSRYCEYEWSGPGAPQPASLPSIVVGGQVVPADKWLDRDCDKLAKMSSPWADAEAIVGPVLESAHAVQMELPASPIPAGNGPVEVAIVDTWPELARAGRSTHGIGMAGIVDDIACGALSGACPVTTIPALALDRYNETGARDLVHGGAWGFPARLAASIYSVATPPPGIHRVLNLSVAWDGRYNGSTSEPGTLAKPMQAVLDVLNYAACQGVLVVAASGNATGTGAADSGPMYPAAWETLPAPACTNAARPLLYSAHAVDGRDQPVFNTRPGARSVLAAPGFMVPSNKPANGIPILAGPFTGTSVASADVSAVAALVWSYAPNLKAHQVMNVLRNTAQSLGVPADYCGAGWCGPIRRISACRALGAVGVASTCNTIAAGAGSNPVYEQDTMDDLATVQNRAFFGTSELTTDYAFPNQCSISTRSDASPGITDAKHACPTERLPNETLYPSIDPQPEPRDPPDGYLAKPDEIVEIWVSEKEPGKTFLQTLTLTFDRTAVARFDLTAATDDLTGTRLGEGLDAGSVTQIDMTGQLGGYTFNGAQLEWLTDVTYGATAILVKE